VRLLQSKFWCGSAPILYNYYHHHPRWNLWLSRNHSCSFFWPGLFPSLEAFRVCLRSFVGNGNSTLFWLDNWHDGQAPKHCWRDDFQSTTYPFATVREAILSPLSVEMRDVNYFSRGPQTPMFQTPPRNKSFFWASLSPILPSFRFGTSKNVKNGESTLLW